tara:strand:+ start:2782 stop:3951 length:1170 start_codon:yes stop_codon:yes gene_type:complete
VIKETGFAFRDWIFGRFVSIRSLSKVKNDKIIVGFIAGSKTGLSGSSKILFEAMTDDSRFFTYLVYQESSTRNTFQNATNNAYYRRAFTKIGLFLKTDIWITTHGDFGIPIDYKKYNQKRMELWHGIPFKGFLKENRKQISDSFNRSSTVVITSSFFKAIFSKEWDVKEGILKDLGQPRTDMLINKTKSKEKIKEELGISQKKIVFYAPTHEQDGGVDKPLFPWNSDDTIERILNSIDNETSIIIRPHPYWKKLITPLVEEKIKNDKRVYYMPSSVVNETEELIYISDVLITDWSSIYFDFLLMNKPTIFLDLPNPFKDNFLMKPEERIGYLSSNSKELAEHIDEALNDFQKYSHKYGKELENVKAKTYSNIDGKSTERCISEIIRLVT